MKVLLLEDDPVTRLFVRQTLKGECVLMTSDSAEKAMALYQTCKPDVVFMDIGLPDVDGLELLNRLLQLDEKAYVVMFSGRDTVEMIGGAIKCGAKGFIKKPFDKSDFMQHMVRY